MKLSTVVLSALITVGTSATAQTKTTSRPVKQVQKTNKNPKTPKPEKNTASKKDSIKPINKNPDHYYCPPCGMG